MFNVRTFAFALATILALTTGCTGELDKDGLFEEVELTTSVGDIEVMEEEEDQTTEGVMNDTPDCVWSPEGSEWVFSTAVSHNEEVTEDGRLVVTVDQTPDCDTVTMIQITFSSADWDHEEWGDWRLIVDGEMNMESGTNVDNGPTFVTFALGEWEAPEQIIFFSMIDSVEKFEVESMLVRHQDGNGYTSIDSTSYTDSTGY